MASFKSSSRAQVVIPPLTCARPGDEGGDKFGRLPCHERRPRQAVVLRRKTENPVKNEVFGKSGTWPLFAHFFGPKESGDEAVTSGDKR